jgi:hypothetical protein
MMVPPIPPTFQSEEATVYYYFNLVMPDDAGEKGSVAWIYIAHCISRTAYRSCEI